MRERGIRGSAREAQGLFGGKARRPVVKAAASRRSGSPPSPGAKKAKVPRSMSRSASTCSAAPARAACRRSGRPATRALGRTVCLKLLDKDKTAKFEARFLGLQQAERGGDLLPDCSHKNIVQTFEYGITTEGESLPRHGVDRRAWASTSWWTPTATKLNGNRISYLTQIADALEYVHTTGLPAPRHLPAQRHGRPRGRTSS